MWAYNPESQKRSLLSPWPVFRAVLQALNWSSCLLPGQWALQGSYSRLGILGWILWSHCSPVGISGQQPTCRQSCFPLVKHSWCLSISVHPAARIKRHRAHHLRQRLGDVTKFAQTIYETEFFEGYFIWWFQFVWLGLVLFVLEIEREALALSYILSFLLFRQSLIELRRVASHLDSSCFRLPGCWDYCLVLKSSFVK